MSTICELCRLDGVKMFTLRGWDVRGNCDFDVEESRLGAEEGDSDEESRMRVSVQNLGFENFI